MLFLSMIAVLACYASAQTSMISGSSSIVLVTSGSSQAPSSLATFPVVPVFLPISVPSHLAASVVTAGYQETVFAVDCLSCANTQTYLLTGGESTFVVTNTFMDGEGTTDSPLTISCKLAGGLPATAATCTGSSMISGLGSVGSISTLSASQISYAPLTITAGAQKLYAVPTTAPGSASSSTSALGCEVTAIMSWVVGGAAAAVLGAL